MFVGDSLFGDSVLHGFDSGWKNKSLVFHDGGQSGRAQGREGAGITLTLAFVKFDRRHFHATRFLVIITILNIVEKKLGIGFYQL